MFNNNIIHGDGVTTDSVVTHKQPFANDPLVNDIEFDNLIQEYKFNKMKLDEACDLLSKRMDYIISKAYISDVGNIYKNVFSSNYFLKCFREIIYNPEKYDVSGIYAHSKYEIYSLLLRPFNDSLLYDNIYYINIIDILKRFDNIEYMNAYNIIFSDKTTTGLLLTRYSSFNKRECVQVTMDYIINKCPWQNRQTEKNIIQALFTLDYYDEIFLYLMTQSSYRSTNYNKYESQLAVLRYIISVMEDLPTYVTKNIILPYAEYLKINGIVAKIRTFIDIDIIMNEESTPNCFKALTALEYDGYSFK